MVKNLPVMQETRYSCLENSKDRGVSRATGHVNQELEMTEQLAHVVRARAHTHTHRLEIYPSYQKYMGEGLKVFGVFFFFFHNFSGMIH